MLTYHLGDRQPVSLVDSTECVDVDTEVLLHRDVANAPNLRRGDLRVRADDLQVPLDHILCHLRDITLTVQRNDLFLASLDCLEHISDALDRTAIHSGTA